MNKEIFKHYRPFSRIFTQNDQKAKNEKKEEGKRREDSLFRFEIQSLTHFARIESLGLCS